MARRLKLKNAFMVHWIQIKEERKKPTLKDVLNDLIQKTVRERKLRAAGIDPDELEAKEKKRQRREKKAQMMA
jgi:hypothetical protein